MQIEWLKSRAGRALLLQERQQANRALERVFGDQIVQIGSWGKPGYLLEAARTQTAMIVGPDVGESVDAFMTPERLAIGTDSVDAVLLPHTLELTRDPHAVLREAYRILRPDGKLLVLGFNPFCWWGLRHQLSFAGFPAGVLRHISRYRLIDWLSLLSMRVDKAAPCYVARPRNGLLRLAHRTRWCASAYLVSATKEVLPLSVIRPRLRARPALVAGLVNTSSRNAA